MAKPRKQTHTGWLVMMFLAGDNNLAEEMVVTLQDILTEGVAGEDRIVAQFDPSAMGIATQRYDFKGSRKKTRLDDFRVPFDGSESSTGNPDSLVAFVKWATERHPDPGLKRLLILSGHGSGTTQDFLLKDENAMDALSIPELGAALKAITLDGKQKIDILGFDACFMSMGEVAYEIRKYIDVVVGAEGEEPGFGWPFRR